MNAFFFCIYLSFGDFFLPFGRRDVAIFILLPRKAKSNNENKSRRGRCFFFSLKRNASAVPFRERDLLSLSRISRNDRFVKLVINRFFLIDYCFGSEGPFLGKGSGEG